MTQLWGESPGEEDIVSICHMGLVTATVLYCNTFSCVCLNVLSPNTGGQIPAELSKKKKKGGKESV